MDSPIIPAYEAAKIVENAQYENAKKQLNMVAAIVQKAIANGKRVCSGEGYLDPAVIKQLTDKGYKVENSSWRNEEQWTVSF